MWGLIIYWSDKIGWGPSEFTDQRNYLWNIALKQIKATGTFFYINPLNTISDFNFNTVKHEIIKFASWIVQHFLVVIHKCAVEQGAPSAI